MRSKPARGGVGRAREGSTSPAERTRPRCGCQSPLSVARISLLIDRMPRRRPRATRPLDVALAATLHDPPGALADALRRAQPKLASLYRGVAVATSPPTAAGIAALLADAGMHAG